MGKRQVIGIAAILLLRPAFAGADVKSLLPGDTIVDTSRLTPYVAEYRYHRPQTMKEDGVRVTWSLEQSGEPMGSHWSAVLTTHGDDVSYLDVSEFDAKSLEARRLVVPTMMGDKIGDIHLQFDEMHVSGTIKARDGSAETSVDRTLQTPVFGIEDDLLLALLPKQSARQYRWPTYSPMDDKVNWHRAEVGDSRVIESATGPVRVWIITTDSGELWIGESAPYVYKRIFYEENGEVFLIWDLMSSDLSPD